MPDRLEVLKQKLLAGIDENSDSERRADCVIGTNEYQELLPMYQGLPNNQGSLALVPGQERGASGEGRGANRVETDLSRATEPTAIGGLVASLAQVAEETANPGEQKRQLIRRIESIVNDPKMGRYVAGAAADLVVFHGVPLADLNHILADVDAMRSAGSLKDSSGRFFHFKARELADRCGKPWPKVRQE